jgi:hypothetical protein
MMLWKKRTVRRCNSNASIRVLAVVERVKDDGSGSEDRCCKRGLRMTVVENGGGW